MTIQATVIDESVVVVPPQPGVYPGIPFEDYLKIDAVSQSDLKHLARSPAHYRAYKDSGQKETPSMAIGSAVDDAAFLPGVFERTYVKTELDRRGTKAWQAEEAALKPGQSLIKAPDYEKVQGMLASLRAHRTASILLSDGIAQQTIIWRDPITGLLCKARTDWTNEAHSCLVDLKSTDDARQERWSKIAARLRYNVQQAWYMWGHLILGRPRDAFFFVVIEHEAPHAVKYYQLPSSAVLDGELVFRRDLTTLAGCLKAGTWPDYGEGIVTIDWPRWALVFRESFYDSRGEQSG